MQLTSHGITVDLPPGWEGRIIKRTQPSPAPSVGKGTAALGGSGREERTYPITHLANFALPNDRGDFGSGAVDLMDGSHVFVTLFEYGPESVGQPLFRDQGRPTRVRAAQFSPNQLQRTLAGQAGFQVFFTEQGRAFSLYIVLGSADNARPLVALANEVLAAITIDPR